MDDYKVNAMLTWTKPTNITQLRGFLRLTGYYRKFVRGYVKLAKRLTDLLKKYNFTWNEETTLSFELLNPAMTLALALRLFLNFLSLK